MSVKIFELLHKEHIEIKQMLKQMLESEDQNKRKNVLLTFHKNILAHMKAEENAFYPNLLEEPETKKLALQAYEEHRVAKTLLKELVKPKVTDDEWSAKLQVLTEILMHHIEEEEDEIFKKTDELFQDDELDDIYNDFVSNKGEWMNRRAA